MWTLLLSITAEVEAEGELSGAETRGGVEELSGTETHGAVKELSGAETDEGSFIRIKHLI